MPVFQGRPSIAAIESGLFLWLLLVGGRLCYLLIPYRRILNKFFLWTTPSSFEVCGTWLIYFEGVFADMRQVVPQQWIGAFAYCYRGHQLVSEPTNTSSPIMGLHYSHHRSCG